MTSVQLEAFVAAVEEGSFSAGARRLYMTPQALMRQVSSLEAELGFELLERSAHGVSVTLAGSSYYASAKQMLVFMDSAKVQGRQAAQGKRVLRFAHCGGHIEHNHCLLDLAAEVSAECPDIEQRHMFAEGDEEDILARVGSEIDLLEWVAGSGIDLHGLNFAPAAPCEPVALVSPSHPLACHEGPLDTGDLAGYEIAISDRYWFAALVRDLALCEPDTTVIERGCGALQIANTCMNGGVFIVWDLPSSSRPADFVRLGLPDRYAGTFGFVYGTAPSPETVRALAVAERMFGTSCSPEP